MLFVSVVSKPSVSIPPPASVTPRATNQGVVGDGGVLNGERGWAPEDAVRDAAALSGAALPVGASDVAADAVATERERTVVLIPPPRTVATPSGALALAVLSTIWLSVRVGVSVPPFPPKKPIVPSVAASPVEAVTAIVLPAITVGDHRVRVGLEGRRATGPVGVGLIGHSR